MADTNPAQTPPKHVPSPIDQSSEDKNINRIDDVDRIADKAAKKGEKTEQRYDGDNDIFTK